MHSKTACTHLLALSDYKVFCIFVYSVIRQRLQLLGEELKHLLSQVVIVLMLCKNVLKHPLQDA